MRNINGGRTNPFLPISELSLEDIKTIFTPEFVSQLKLLYMCGTYGDPMVAKDTLRAFEYFRETNPKMKLNLSTNGSGRDISWWKRLASVVSKCNFAIDGLEDTNKIYRRGTNWNKIIDNASVFINAGGKAEWRFLVFKHNEHQVEEARQLSQKLGFQTFVVKKTNRFFRNGNQVQRAEVQDRNGNIEYFLELPTKNEYQNAAFVQLNRSRNPGEAYHSYLDETEIRCKAVDSQSVYISAEGLVFPCCWTASLYRSNAQSVREIWRLIDKLPDGKDSINAKLNPLSEVINGRFFQEFFPAAWEKNSGADRLMVCARTCGKYDIISGQYS